MPTKTEVSEMLFSLPDEEYQAAIMYILFLTDYAEKESADSDPFYSKENIDKIRDRIKKVKTGQSTLKEHELIED